MRNRELGKKAAPWLLLAVLTAAAFSAALWCCGIYPFGSSTILLADLGEQYTDFLVFFRTSSLPEKIYSLSKGFGGETLGLTAYYLLSPFNLLTYLFPAAQIESAVVVILYAKFIAIACCAQFYFTRHETAHALPFALMYALCPFFMMYFFNVLWLDGFALLPLLVWGCECVLEKGETRFFTVAYLCALLVNYYIAYMSSLFILLYFLFYGGAKLALPVRKLVRRALLMARSVALAACLAAPVMLPALMQLQNGKLENTASAGIAQGYRMFNPLLVLTQIFSGTYMFETVPFVFFTAGSLLLFFAYFCTRAYPRREKLGAAALWAFLVLSLYLHPLYLLWHGFQEPEGFPYRFSFVYFFFLLWLGRRGLQGLAQLERKRFAAVSLAALAACGVFYLRTRTSLPWGGHTALRTLAFVLAFGACIWLASHKKNYALPALGCVLAVAVMLDSVSVFRGYYAASPSAGVPRDYAQNYTVKQALLAQQAGTDVFYRTEDISQRPGNQPMALGYCGTTHYSSTFDGTQKAIYRHFLGKESFLGTYYNDSRVQVDSLFGIRYVLAGENLTVDGAYAETAAEGGSVLYENPYALPVLFAMPETEIPYTEDGNAHLNALYAALNGGRAVYDGQSGTVDYDALAAAAQTAQNGAAHLTQRSGGTLTATITAQDGDMLAMTIPYDAAWHITVDGRRVKAEKFMEYFMAVPLAAGTHTIHMTYVPAGLAAGTVLFGAALAALLAGALLRRKKRLSSAAA